VFEWIPGDVPDASPFRLEPDQQREAALLIRRFHDAASSFPGVGGAETVEHGDLGPHNTVFSRGRPVAIIDWDSSVVPGTRARDFAQAVWGFADLLEDEVDIAAQSGGLSVMCSAYGDITAEVVLDELQARFIRARADHRAHGRLRAVQAFDDVLLRLDRDRPDLLGGR
jgi:aminoglycoside phosphotransferase (APT) family kinase protein